MALFHCDECWDNPCTCGYEYADWSIGQICLFILVLISVMIKKIFKYMRLLR